MADVVGGEVVGRLEIDADEVADGVVVFGAVEAADGDAARIGFGVAVGLIPGEVDGLRQRLDAPRAPAEDQESTFPETSVMVMMVLLNVLWM